AQGQADTSLRWIVRCRCGSRRIPLLAGQCRSGEQEARFVSFPASRIECECPTGEVLGSPMPFIVDAAPRWAPTPIRLSARRFCARRAAFLVELTRPAVAAAGYGLSEVSQIEGVRSAKRRRCIAPWA